MKDNQKQYEPPHRGYYQKYWLSPIDAEDSSSLPENWGVGIPVVILYLTNPRIFAGHHSVIPSSDTKLIIA